MNNIENTKKLIYLLACYIVTSEQKGHKYRDRVFKAMKHFETEKNEIDFLTMQVNNGETVEAFKKLFIRAGYKKVKVAKDEVFYGFKYMNELSHLGINLDLTKFWNLNLEVRHVINRVLYLKGLRLK